MRLSFFSERRQTPRIFTGNVLEERNTGDVTEEAAEKAIRNFIGEYDQIPPMYSALKVGGKKLYELAREGKTVERKSRKVTIHDIRISEIRLPEIRMEVDCSKGTYIRTLCNDIGELLGTGGCMKELKRLRSAGSVWKKAGNFPRSSRCRKQAGLRK